MCTPWPTPYHTLARRQRFGFVPGESVGDFVKTIRKPSIFYNGFTESK